MNAGLPARRRLLGAIVVAAIVAWVGLGLHREPLEPTSGGWDAVGKFFSAALHPAWTYESAPVGPIAPLPVRTLRAALDTIRYAGAAVTLSVVLGLVLGFCGSSAWWDYPGAPQGRAWRVATRGIWVAARGVMTLCRCTHELILAMLLLSAMGLTPVAAVLAIAIPFSGTLAKVFAEMIDETPRDAMEAMVGGGARPWSAWLFGLFPRALPDLFSYVLYRFECGLRSATVLGFWGFNTLGLCLQQAFDNGDYRETWTYLYAMLALVLCFDWWSGAIRRRMREPQWRTGGGRPYDLFLRVSAWLVAALGAITLVTGLGWEIRWATASPAWLAVEEIRPTLSEGEWDRRATNVARFMGELTPDPMRAGSEVTWGMWGERLWNLIAEPAARTLGISVVAIVLAGIGAALTVPLAARVSAVAQPWLKNARAATVAHEWAWRLLRYGARALHMLTRAIPEIVIAFLLLNLLGGKLWPAVLALAIHNMGILGRLGAEVVENTPRELPEAMRGIGQSRLQVLGLSLLPVLLLRGLVYFFYRWETCLRETTALGILGCATLGLAIREVNARQRHDDMIVIVIVSALLVAAVDIFSTVVRRWARRAV
jgi:phosphonate transport system permease protein